MNFERKKMKSAISVMTAGMMLLSGASFIPQDSVSAADESSNGASGTNLSAGESGETNYYASASSTFAMDPCSQMVVGDSGNAEYYFHDTFESSETLWSGRGGASVSVSSKSAANGSKSLLVSGRSDTWNGAMMTLGSSFEPGKSYSFSVCAARLTGNTEDNFKLTLEYKDSSGETQYDKIALTPVVKGVYVQLANKEYTIPAGATNMQLIIESEKATADFYIDEAIGAPAGTVIEPPVQIIKNSGDLNGDGKLGVIDSTLMKSGIIEGFSAENISQAADINGDGKCDVADLVLLHSFLLGKITEFPVIEVPEPPKAEMRTISEYTPTVKMSEFETNDSKQEKPGVQYGTVKKGTYYSTTCKREKPYNILLPANYSESKQYPVLYVMHGYYEKQDRMIIKGNGTMYTRQIIGNAIADESAEDMIVVFPYVFSSATQADCSGMNDANNAAYDNFINDLITDLMPHIEETYSIKTGRENTAITGFSMGGRESLLIGMKRPDLFGYIGAICPAPGVTGAFKWNSEEEAPSLVLITAGSNDTVVYSNPENYHNNFTKNGVPNIWHYVNGGYHGDNCIHAHIYNFVRAVFKA